MHTKEELIGHIRKRPGMYVGALDVKGIKNMLEYFLDETIDGTREQEFIIELFDHNRIDITITGTDIIAFNKRLDGLTQKGDWDGFGLYCLVALSEKIHIWQDIPAGERIEAHNGTIIHWPRAFDTKGKHLHVSFTFDSEIFKDLVLDYGHLAHFLRKFAYLNPLLRIITEDHVLHQRNILHYPGGINSRLKETIARLPYAYPRLYLNLSTHINGFSYHIALCYPNTVCDSFRLRSFTNHYETLMGGSLVDGILKGLADAFKTIDTRKTLRINRRTVKKGLLLLATVKGKEFEYRGSTRGALGMPQIEKDIRQYVYTQTTKHLQTHPQDLEAMISHFCINQGAWHTEEDEV